MAQVVQQEPLARLLVEKGTFNQEKFWEIGRMVDQGLKTKNEGRVASKQNDEAKSGNHEED